MSDAIDVDPRKLVAEVVGTFAFIFIGTGSVIVTGGTNLVGIAIAHGLAIALLASALGHVSGALFNPALTIGLWVTRQMDTANTVAYIIAQLIGAVLGALALVLFFPEVMRDASSLGTPMLNPGVNFAQGVGIEVILTMFLMLTVFGTALDKRGPKIGGFGIGLTLTMGLLAAGPLTGWGMNPARAFGPALLSGEWANHLVYWIGPIVGSVLAALLYQYVFSEEASVGGTGESAAGSNEPDSREAAPVEDVAEAVEPVAAESEVTELEEPIPEADEPEADDPEEPAPDELDRAEAVGAAPA